SFAAHNQLVTSSSICESLGPRIQAAEPRRDERAAAKPAIAHGFGVTALARFAFLDFLRLRLPSIVFAAFNSVCFWCKTGAVQGRCFAPQHGKMRLLVKHQASWSGAPVSIIS